PEDNQKDLTDDTSLKVKQKDLTDDTSLKVKPEDKQKDLTDDTSLKVKPEPEQSGEVDNGISIQPVAVYYGIGSFHSESINNLSRYPGAFFRHVCVCVCART